jgi:membrane protease YdiL (CAAX protease family)
VSPAAFLGLALIAMVAAGKALPGVADFGRFSGIPAIGLVGVLLLITVGALGEETGWRGYALPQLQRRFSPLTSSLIIAVLWFGWHLPQFFRDRQLPGLRPGPIRWHVSRADHRRGRLDLAVQPVRRQHPAGCRLARAVQLR